MTRLLTEIAIEDDRWGAEAPLQSLCETVFSAVLKATKIEILQGSEVSVVFTNDDAIKTLNTVWRDKDKPTNVLSFPIQQISPGDTPPLMLGDIVLAVETLQCEAGEMNISFEAHLTHLLTHGFLHLLGYDHIHDDEAEEMEALEIVILAGFGLENPYIEAQ